METTIFYIVVIISFLSVVTNAEVDCEAPANFKQDPKECCAIPTLISEEIVEKCQGIDKRGPPQPTEGLMEGSDNENRPHPSGPSRHRHHGKHGGRHHHHHHCSCVLNETGILVDGQLNEDNLDTFLDNAGEETPEIIPLLKESFQECYQKSVEIMQKIHERFGGAPPINRRGPPGGRCSPQGDMIFHCAMMKTFKACPDSMWSKSDECNEVREYFTECMKPSKEDEEI
ncbi:general odorant-binding protein 67 isoform X1 [Stomoxys calcitrans]|uniref:general odorant-binding protein 67 isoform X1 n=1 Tax=Stomoxys calcitrans TaxID=35570 RepID=UPI0027E3687E|nr:general odorant-binding protein 67 isoform X1 [Stomoxys calcitrans]